MQVTSSGSHGSSNIVPLRAEPTTAVDEWPPGDAVGLERAPLVIDARVENGPGEPVGEAPPAMRILGVPIDVRAPIAESDVDPPVVDAVCARAIGELGVPLSLMAVAPMLDCAATSDGIAADGLVDVPIVGMVDVPMRVDVPIEVDAATVGVVGVPIDERDVPLVRVEVVPSVESVVVADPVCREVRAGSVVAEGPTPSLAAKELKSVACPKPRDASKASKSGSDEIGVIGVAMDNVDMPPVVVGTVDVVVVMPPSVVVGPKVGACACATQGVTRSATGAISPMILFMPPPVCRGFTPAKASTTTLRRGSVRLRRSAIASARHEPIAAGPRVHGSTERPCGSPVAGRRGSTRRRREVDGAVFGQRASLRRLLMSPATPGQAPWRWTLGGALCGLSVVS